LSLSQDRGPDVQVKQSATGTSNCRHPGKLIVAKQLNMELFDTLLEARVLIERWRIHYNTVRLHSSLGYRPPAPEAVLTKQTTT
jgi:transposase InsO family protein